jgi:2',3'-cyclic-nucleotide 2'-phosphodiesterase (5'-nucleotidase family)
MVERIFLLAASVLVALAQAVPLRIAYTGFVHGGITGTGGDTFCMINGLPDTSQYCLGGCDRRQAFFEQKKTADPDTIIADVGNYYWGSVFFTVYSFSPGLECFRRARYDVSGIGGSDMYSGYPWYSEWVRMIAESPVPSGTLPTAFIATNVAFGPNTGGINPLADIVKTSWLKTLSNGLKVGFITPFSPYYSDTIEASEGDIVINPRTSTANHLRQEISKLRQQGAVVIVMMMEFTEDFDENLSLPSELEHVRIVLTCRNNDLYKKTITNDYGQQVLVLSVGNSFGTSVGWIDADFNITTGEFTNLAAALAVSGPVIINGTMPTNAATRTAILADYDLASNEAFTQRIAATRAAIYGENGEWETPSSPLVAGCRTASCPMGRLVVQSMLDYCPAGSPYPCVAFLSGGDIRGSISPYVNPATGLGTIRIADVYQVLPFFNSMVTLNVKGSVIMTALANSISQRPVANGRFLQSNIRFTFNAFDRDDIEPGDYASRVLEASLRSPATGEWTEINVDATYSLVTSSYLTSGHDGYTDLARNAGNQTELGVTFSDVFIDYIVKTYNDTNTPVAVPSQAQEQACTAARHPLPAASMCMTMHTNQTLAEFQHCGTDADFCAAHADSFLFGAIWVSGGSACADCSGIGSCKARRCDCSGTHAVTVPDGAGGSTTELYTFYEGAPTTGRWAGVQLIRGDKCSEMRSVWALGASEKAAMYVAAAIAYLVSIAWFVLLFISRNKSVMRASSPLFGMIMCLGGVVGATSIMMDAHPNNSDSCNASVWLIVTGYSLIFACLFVKTHRIHTIFNAKRLKGRSIYTDAWVLAYVGVVVFVNLVILTIFRIVAPLQLRPFVLSSSFAVGEHCSGDDFTVGAVLFVFNGLLLAWGIYLAVCTRNVDSNFNESKFIGVAVYNCAFSAIVLLLVMYVISSSAPSAAFVIKAWLITYIIVFTLSIMFVPRVKLIIRGISKAESQDTASHPSDLERALAREKRTVHVLAQRLREHVAERDDFITSLCKILQLNSLHVPEVVFKPVPDAEAIAAIVASPLSAPPSAPNTPHGGRQTSAESAAAGGSGSNPGSANASRRGSGNHLGLTASGAVRRPLFANQLTYVSRLGTRGTGAISSATNGSESATETTAGGSAQDQDQDQVVYTPLPEGSSSPLETSFDVAANRSSVGVSAVTGGDIELVALRTSEEDAL